MTRILGRFILYGSAAVILMCFILIYTLKLHHAAVTAPTPPTDPNQTPLATISQPKATQTLPFTPPLEKTRDRVTLKPFSIQASPRHSPVQPERFSGIHTGTDFETFPEEVNKDISVKTICTGRLLRKQQARGYGGMAVQACTLNDNPITVVYGHLRLASITAHVNDELEQGSTLGLLGKGFSSETGGERKHLHLGIHKGPSVVTNGYISNHSDLQNWLDVMQYIQ